MDLLYAYLIFFLIAFVAFVIWWICYTAPYRRHLTEVAEYYQDYHESREDISAIKKRLRQNHELFVKTEKQYEEAQRKNHVRKESKKREAIIMRVFAYEYEELLYQIFAPLAKSNDAYSVWGWTTLCSEGYSKDYIIQKISEIKNIPISEAESIFHILVKHKLIYKYHEYLLTRLLETSRPSSPEDYLCWDIVTDIDMNLDKWMNEHGYVHKR